jgi:hypothetical protein
MTARKPPEEHLPDGRPTKYKPEYDEQVYKLCLLGLIDKEIARYFEISESTLNLWKLEHPSFSESIKNGKKNADAKVAASLYQRANGYEQPEDKIFQYEGAPVIVPTIKHYPPDVTAQIFWLKNRQSKIWRDKHEIESTRPVVIQFDESDRGLVEDMEE